MRMTVESVNSFASASNHADATDRVLVGANDWVVRELGWVLSQKPVLDIMESLVQEDRSLMENRGLITSGSCETKDFSRVRRMAQSLVDCG